MSAATTRRDCRLDPQDRPARFAAISDAAQPISTCPLGRSTVQDEIAPGRPGCGCSYEASIPSRPDGRLQAGQRRRLDVHAVSIPSRPEGRLQVCTRDQRVSREFQSPAGPMASCRVLGFDGSRGSVDPFQSPAGLNTAGVLLGYGAYRIGDSVGRAVLPPRLVFWGQ